MRKAQENDFVVYVYVRKKGALSGLTCTEDGAQDGGTICQSYQVFWIKYKLNLKSSTWGNAKHDENRSPLQPLPKEIIATFFLFISTDPGLSVDDNSTAKSVMIRQQEWIEMLY